MFWLRVVLTYAYIPGSVLMVIASFGIRRTPGSSCRSAPERSPEGDKGGSISPGLSGTMNVSPFSGISFTENVISNNRPSGDHFAIQAPAQSCLGSPPEMGITRCFVFVLTCSVGTKTMAHSPSGERDLVVLISLEVTFSEREPSALAL